MKHWLGFHLIGAAGFFNGYASTSGSKLSSLAGRLCFNLAKLCI